MKQANLLSDNSNGDNVGKNKAKSTENIGDANYKYFIVLYFKSCQII